MNTRRIMPYSQRLLISLGVVFLLTGCATDKKDDHLIPQQGLTVQEIYRQSGQGETVNAVAGDDEEPSLSMIDARAQLLPVVYPVSTQSSPFATSPEQFALLENPSIPIYVYPHLVAMGNDEVPVDGYTTVFFLYSKNHYALPWEHY